MTNSETSAKWHGSQSRQIMRRIVIEGDLELVTPAHFGGGEEDAANVLMLLRDSVEPERPLLQGTSIAGALRSYLSNLLGKDDKVIKRLFGGTKKDRNSDQSSLMVDDAIGDGAKVVYRDGVRINPESRTAEEGALYQTQLWAAGTKFPLRFEYLHNHTSQLPLDLQLLAVGLNALANSEIPFGMRKNRGYGKVKVKQWKVRTYDLKKPADLIAWLGDKNPADMTTSDDIFRALKVERKAIHSPNFSITATFTIDGSLLIRSAANVVDFETLQDQAGPVISGTALTGALRARATKILRTVRQTDHDNRDNAIVAGKIDGIFGTSEIKHASKEPPLASRLRVEEVRILNSVYDKVQSRVSIDRFTGGALDTALFSEMPAFGGEVTLVMQLIKPTDAEIGLLLLLLKDLWTGDLPIGGEQSVGRGRLKGRQATITHGEHVYTISDESLKSSHPDKLEAYVKSFTGWATS
jgi:CRISPR/Cas system CSM-associated protein Csm3 (group 7 of RAMP superfamily)